MQINKMTTAVMVIGSIGVFALADGPVITDVVARQRWPWSKLVDIDYVLSCEPHERMEVAFTARNGTEPLNIPQAALSGDLRVVAPGPRRIILDPSKTEYAEGEIMTQFNVTLTPSPAPFYMVVDLTKSVGADGQVEYIYAGDPRLMTEGRYTNVWLDVTNDTVYATDKLVLRRINAGAYRMGPLADIDVILTKDFFIGVFEITQRQWELVMGTRPSLFSNETFYATRPVEQISYNLMRGSTAQGVDWPSTGTFVAPNSFVYKLRAATGFDRFDLPTDAQWEYACRAGTATVFNDGDPDATIASPHNITNPWLDSLGRYKYNGGYLNTGDTAIPPAGAGDWTTANGTARVGSYIPNAWGLYDMQGNVYEWVKDEHINPPPGGVDPVSDNPDGTNRIKRGGSWHRNAYQCSASERGADGASTVHYSFGLRVLIDLP